MEWDCHSEMNLEYQDGVRALWTGLGPNVAHNAMMNADNTVPAFTNNVLTHLLSGLGARFFVVCVGSPVDVVKSRMMGDPSYHRWFC
ncbi:mitochondrial uncoupling protein 1 [Artemisia annua]|uniref:Mitochondrial uncoupling protein 1 n=1 Tax=Artemisia annua TaxID=35608 RepID=A0A2U1MQJ6_ARTAN|nr:mitochondrial uncoupling protein 1 [Artemisia annua]